MRPNLRIKTQLASAEVDLIFHDCGDLNGFMVEQFATRLDPAILSLGSSRTLWEDAALVPKSVVLFGNLPTKKFYSDEAMPDEQVKAMTLELRDKDAVGRPPAHSRLGVRRTARSRGRQYHPEKSRYHAYLWPLKTSKAGSEV